MKKVILNVDSLNKVYQLSERAIKLLFYMISIMDEYNIVLFSLNEAFYNVKMSAASLHKGKAELLEKGIIMNTGSKENRKTYFRVSSEIAHYESTKLEEDKSLESKALDALRFVIKTLKD